MGKSTNSTEENTKATKENTDTNNKNTKSIKEKKEAYQDLDEHVRQYNKLFEDAARVVEQYQTKQEQLTNSIARYAQMLSVGALTQAEYNKVITGIIGDYNDVNDAIDKNTDKVKNEIPEAYKTAATSIQNSFTDMFRDILKDGEIDFDSFADNMKDIFINMIAEMATMAIARPIILNTVSGVAGALGVPGDTQAGVIQQLGGKVGGNLLSSAAGNLFTSGGINAGITGLANSIGIGGTFAGIGAPTTAYGSMVGINGAAITGSGALGAIGAALPWIGGALAIASAVGLFDSDSDVTPDLNLNALGAGTNGANQFSNSDVSGTILAKFGNLGFSTQHDGVSSQSQADQLIANLNQISLLDDAISEIIGETLTETVLGGMENWAKTTKSEDPEDFERSIGEMMSARFGKIFDLIGGDIDELYDSFGDDWEGGLDAVIQKYAELNQTIIDTTAAIDMINAGFNSVMADITGTSNSTIEKWTLSTLDTAGKQSYYQNKVNTLYDQLQSSTDPNEIKSLHSQILSYGDRAFSLLSDEDKQSNLDNALRGIEELNKATTSGLTKIRDDQLAAANTQLEAAQTMLEAARTPTKVVVQLADSEVG